MGMKVFKAGRPDEGKRRRGGLLKPAALILLLLFLLLRRVRGRGFAV
jgi:hypothetical protein